MGNWCDPLMYLMAVLAERFGPREEDSEDSDDYSNPRWLYQEKRAQSCESSTLDDCACNERDCPICRNRYAKRSRSVGPTAGTQTDDVQAVLNATQEVRFYNVSQEVNFYHTCGGGLTTDSELSPGPARDVQEQARHSMRPPNESPQSLPTAYGPGGAVGRPGEGDVASGTPFVNVYQLMYGPSWSSLVPSTFPTIEEAIRTSPEPPAGAPCVSHDETLPFGEGYDTSDDGVWPEEPGASISLLLSKPRPNVPGSSQDAEPTAQREPPRERVRLTPAQRAAEAELFGTPPTSDDEALATPQPRPLRGKFVKRIKKLLQLRKKGVRCYFQARAYHLASAATWDEHVYDRYKRLRQALPHEQLRKPRKTPLVDGKKKIVKCKAPNRYENADPAHLRFSCPIRASSSASAASMTVAEASSIWLAGQTTPWNDMEAEQPADSSPVSDVTEEQLQEVDRPVERDQLGERLVVLLSTRKRQFEQVRTLLCKIENKLQRGSSHVPSEHAAQLRHIDRQLAYINPRLEALRANPEASRVTPEEASSLDDHNYPIA